MELSHCNDTMNGCLSFGDFSCMNLHAFLPGAHKGTVTARYMIVPYVKPHGFVNFCRQALSDTENGL